MATAAERQAKRRKKLEGDGLVPVTGYVPAALAGELMAIMKMLCEDRSLEVGPLRNVVTGRLVRSRGK